MWVSQTNSVEVEICCYVNEEINGKQSQTVSEMILRCYYQPTFSSVTYTLSRAYVSRGTDELFFF